MNVALLTPVYWPEVRRGSERFTHELAGGLLDRGHRPRIITGHHGLPRRAQEDGVEVLRVPRGPEGRMRRRMYEEHLTHLPFAYAALRRGRDDIAHAVYPTDALAALRWRDRGGGPVVLGYMGIPHRISLANRRWRKEIVARAARDADAVVALGPAAAEGFRRWLGVEARVIAPGVDLEAFRPDPAARAPAPTILFAADRTQPRKRFGLLAEAFALVRRERPAARLVVSRVRGAAPLALEGVQERDLDDRAALAAANREAWVSALPSWGEAFGLVLTEALASGTPAVGPSPDILDRPEVGRVFDGPDDDAAGLARALLEALELAAHPATAVACRSRAGDFSTDRTAEAHIALYEELLTRAS